MPYSYSRKITVDHTQCGTADTTNFPMLFDSILNAAHVTSASGFDIIFAANSDGASPYNWEIENYNSGTGEFVAWVQIPTLSHTTDTVFYVVYGNGSISNNQSASIPWDSNYLGVYHLGDASTVSTTDSTNNANNLTNHGGTAAAGEIRGGVTLDGSTQYLSLASAPVATVPITMECWFKFNSSKQGVMISELDTGSANFYGHYLDVSSANANIDTADNNSFTSAIDTTTLTDGNWYYVVGVWASSSSRTIYVNADAGFNDATNKTPGQNPNDFVIGCASRNTQDNFCGGTFDEVRLSNTNRSTSYITATYNSTVSGTTFYSLAAEPSSDTLFSQSCM